MAVCFQKTKTETKLILGSLHISITYKHNKPRNILQKPNETQSMCTTKSAQTYRSTCLIWLSLLLS